MHVNNFDTYNSHNFYLTDQNHDYIYGFSQQRVPHSSSLFRYVQFLSVTHSQTCPHLELHLQLTHPENQHPLNISAYQMVKAGLFLLAFHTLKVWVHRQITHQLNIPGSLKMLFLSHLVYVSHCIRRLERYQITLGVYHYQTLCDDLTLFLPSVSYALMSRIRIHDAQGSARIRHTT